MIEKQVEKKVCDYAKERGLLVYKFTSPGHNFVPDRMFIMPDGRVFFIELKRPGGKPTSGQLREHERMRKHNVPVFVVDDVDHGKELIDVMMIGVV